MNYYIKEGIPKGEYNASSKARNDVEKVFKNLKIPRLFVNSLYGVQEKKYLKWKQLYIYRNNLKAWMDSLVKLNSGDRIFIQYPLLNTTYSFEKFLVECSKKNIETIAIIHDLDSLRFTVENDGKNVVKRVSHEDHTYLPLFSKVICHNESMKNELLKFNVNESSIIILGIFDYLTNVSGNIDRFNLQSPIVIAGNLNTQKVGYLEDLNLLKNLNFNLYGMGYSNKSSANVFYKGAFKPEDLLLEIKGSFGLVWDGDSLDTCKGGYGKYLQYNNPHKASMYLAAGLPLIVWKDSALSDFVEKENLGLCISSLLDLETVIRNISLKDYMEIKRKCAILSEKVKNGYFMVNAISKCIEE